MKKVKTPGNKIRVFLKGFIKNKKNNGKFCRKV